MANKQLTAKVRLNTSQAERSIDNMVKKINRMNNALNKTGTNQVEQQLRRSNTQVNSIVNKVRTWATNQRQVLSHTKSTNSALGNIGSKLKGIAATYLGIMGAKSLMNTSDTITSAQNKLNYVNASQMGSAGYTSDGKDYSNATFNATAGTMDKMYASAQKVRMGYDDMMNNVAKSMVLAGDSFNGNIDNAIRFQEIMAEAYTIGGASAQEMSSSMYQLIQALGAGTLAGDELRSVREGASLAYDKIEDFVQGVYNTEESLKDLASQGKVTADMVVAAVMQMGNEMDNAFAKTRQTFAQTGKQIKNAAIKAFEPVANKLNDMLNKAIDNGLIQKVEAFFTGVAKVALIALELISRGIDWVVANWEWLQWVVLGVILVIIGHIIIWTVTTIANAIIRIAMYIAEYWWLLLIVAVIIALIYIYIQWKNAGIDTCTALTTALAIVALAIVIVGIVTGSTFLVVMGVIIAIVAAIFYYLPQIMGGILWLGAGISNVCQWIGIAFDASWAWVSTGAKNTTHRIIGFFVGLGSAVSAIGSGICDTFNWVGDTIKYYWGEAITWMAHKLADLLSGLSGLGKITIFGKTIFDGLNFDGAVAKLQSVSNESSNPGSLGDVWNGRISDAYSTGYNDWTDKHIDQSAKDAWDDKWSNYDPYDLGAAYNIGVLLGNALKGKINEWGSQFQTGGGDFDLASLLGMIKDGVSLDSVGKSLGLDFSNMLGGSELNPDNAPSADDLLNGVDNLNKGVGGIGKDTGSIADSMDLAEEDLAYLRDLADREWKKEFTTANITVDMSNYNTINGENDLDGIVTKLADKLYEEMNSLADGVYA